MIFALLQFEEGIELLLLFRAHNKLNKVGLSLG